MEQGKKGPSFSEERTLPCISGMQNADKVACQWLATSGWFCPGDHEGLSLKNAPGKNSPAGPILDEKLVHPDHSLLT